MQAVIAEVSLHAGCLQKAHRLIVAALEDIEETGEGLYKAELYRLKGEVLWRQTQQTQDSLPFCQIEASFLTAIHIAQLQRARLWELRALNSLSRLYMTFDRTDEAKYRLEAIYHWFTDGFEFPDLLEAKTLLRQMSASSTDLNKLTSEALQKSDELG